MIYQGKYVIPIAGDPSRNGQVLVRNGQICGVGVDLDKLHTGEDICDLSNCALLPGFVNAHSHIDYTLSQNTCDGLNLWDWLDNVAFGKGRVPDYGQLVQSATLGAAKCASSGITCVGDSSFSGAAADGLGAVGLRGIVYRELFGQSMGNEYREKFSKFTEDVRLKQSEFSGLIKVGISPHTIYTSNREVLELCANANVELGIPIALHLAETWAEAEYSISGTGPLADWRCKRGYRPMTSGLSPTRYLGEVGLLRRGVCLAHCVHIDEEEAELIAKSGASVAHCPRSNAFLGAGIAPLTSFIKNEIPVGLGTDSLASCK